MKICFLRASLFCACIGSFPYAASRQVFERLSATPVLKQAPEPVFQAKTAPATEVAETAARLFEENDKRLVTSGNLQAHTWRDFEGGVYERMCGMEGDRRLARQEAT